MKVEEGREALWHGGVELPQREGLGEAKLMVWLFKATKSSKDSD